MTGMPIRERGHGDSVESLISATKSNTARRAATFRLHRPGRGSGEEDGEDS